MEHDNRLVYQTIATMASSKTSGEEKIMTELQSVSDRLDNKSEGKLALEDNDKVICNNAVDEYFIGIKGDLNQAERLVSDAVNNLVINFRYISKLTESHHEMVLVIERMATPEASSSINELLEKQMVIANQIEQELEMVITSLQFGDLVAQLLAHTTRQVEMLNVELQRIDRQGGWQRETEREALDSIHSGISKAIDVVKNKSKKKPVVQQGMQMGDVELF
ncbi:hypothetical protein [Nitrosomonas ureae]|uniref:Chemotaxis protein CheZ n=3 Tax=Nitrosomonas ureae TaxID=44577 RepID=A0A0S3AKZ6_9PROT|nr:hypothetical protein [Nitrosomonas ureae]ALQ51841.1 hypothetical protein ATY38_11810 [Nitrosomonas ureae]PXX14270.1 hypothetical protein C8R27_1163 [Nitrosomonas ureae]SDU15976.1 hypothetical protein SAMN05216406_1298 [Nitrosomonas ureae]SEP69311.1 hypothetical protein SAMN05421510_10028 [Nitrosomonas ureae]